jgi:putative SOS response-associated peptidase YedK
MCGRFGLRTDPRDFVRTHLRGRVAPHFRFEPHWNIAPTQDVLVVPNTRDRELTAMRWSLEARGSRTSSSRLSTFNARVETLATSPLFAPLLTTRRAVVLADGYYEWRANRDGSKTPVWVFRRDGALMTFAALWDRRFANDAPPLSSVTIVTREPVAALAPVHDRMPAILPAEVAESWLAAERLDARAALELLLPVESEAFSFHAVSARVGNVRNDDASLVIAVPDPLQDPLPFE